MALANHTLTLISIYALLFYTFYVEALSGPSPSPAATPVVKTGVEPEKVMLVLNPSDLLLPDVMDTIPETTSVDKQAEVANVVAKQMQAIELKIDEFNTALKKQLENPETSDMAQECIKECEEVFGAAIDDIKNSLDSLERKNLFKANFDVSAVSTNVDTCYDCFNEMVGEDLNLKKLDDWVRGVTEEALKTLDATSS